MLVADVQNVGFASVRAVVETDRPPEAILPELPEVETVRRSLAPYVEGALIESVTLNRKDLRTPFPRGFAKALEGKTIERIDRRAKYLLFRLSSGKTWIAHLGMTGSFRFKGITLDKQSRYFEPVIDEKHDHVVVAPQAPQARQADDDLRRCPPLRDDEPHRRRRDERRDRRSRAGAARQSVQRRRDGGALPNKATPVKAALLDQRVVAGLGNIYVSEALHRAHIRPTVQAKKLVLKSGAPTKRLEDLAAAIPTVLTEAIEVGGSTLRDFRSGDGAEGSYPAPVRGLRPGGKALPDARLHRGDQADRPVRPVDLLLSGVPEGLERPRSPESS